jgi:hypothetical protein
MQRGALDRDRRQAPRREPGPQRRDGGQLVRQRGPSGTNSAQPTGPKKPIVSFLTQ